MSRFDLCMLTASLALISGAAGAVSITVAPTSGTAGTAVTNSIADAITQINAGADASNTIVLRSTEGAHVLPANTTWAFGAGKNVTFNAESGQPVVVLSYATGNAMLTISGGTNAVGQTETLTFNGIAFVAPATALTYAHNVADGIVGSAGVFVFNNCVFSNNNGSNGVASQEGAVAYSATANNVGDDWLQFSTTNNATLSNCTVTGAHDDAILFRGSDASPNAATLRLENGTCIANNGGAGIQVYDQYAAVVTDGTAARVLIADNGKRGPTDTGIKFFWDAGCSLTMTKTDVIGHNNAGIFDFEGVPTISLTDCRLAFNNSGPVATAGNFAVDDISNDSNYAQAISFTRVTMHDAGGDSIAYADGATDSAPTYTIVDSIFSGAGDTFNLLNPTNTTAQAVNKTFSAVVTAGAHAVSAVGELGAGSVSADPEYVSLAYTIGRGQANADFLLPNSTAYATAGSGGSRLTGGAPSPSSGVADWSVYE